MKDWLSKMRLRAPYAISTSDPMCCLHMIIYIVVMCMRSVRFLFIVWIHVFPLPHCKCVSRNFNDLGGG